MIPGLLLLGALLLWFLGLKLYARSRQLRRATGLPPGEIIYVDTGAWHRADRPLFSSHYRLTGKPDYLVRTGREVIPVEVKSTPLRGDDPYDSHKLQLAAYCLLVEDTTGVRPSHGILKYPNIAFKLPYTHALQQELLATLAAMRRARNAPNMPRSHDEPALCRRCGFRSVCGNEALSADAS